MGPPFSQPSGPPFSQPSGPPFNPPSGPAQPAQSKALAVVKPPPLLPPPVTPTSGAVVPGTELAVRPNNIPTVLKPMGDGTLALRPALLPHDTRMTPATNPAGLYGFQGMMDDAYPPGFET